jgi:hypothetical protein
VRHRAIGSKLAAHFRRKQSYRELSHFWVGDGLVECFLQNVQPIERNGGE